MAPIRRRREYFTADQVRELVMDPVPTADSDSESENSEVDSDSDDVETGPTHPLLRNPTEHDTGVDINHDSDSEFEEERDDVSMVSADNEPDEWIRLEDGDEWEADWLDDFSENDGRPKLLFDVNQNTKPVDFFYQFFPVELFDLMARETNRYARQTLQRLGVLQEHSRLNKWTETNAEEMKAFTGVQMAMGLTTKPALPMYWEEHWMVATPGFGTVMSRNRFELLNSMLHFADNDDRIPRGQDGHDILYKVKPVMNIVQPTYQASIQPGLSLSVDESLAPFKGRLQFKQYMPLKPTKWGVKFWVLADAKSGLCLDCNVYTGKDAERAAAPGGVTSAIVKGLVRPYYGSGRHVYMDNFYSSPELYDHLADNKLGACGTVRLSRRGIPNEMKAASAQSRKGDQPAFFKKGRMLGVSWHDTKRVSVLSTIHNNSTVEKEIRHRGSENGRRTIVKPKVVEKYNENMGGVDLLDQRMSYYRYPHRHMKWYRVIYHFLMEIALVNGHIASRISRGNRPKESTRKFRLQVISGLVDTYRKVNAGRPRALREINRDDRTAVRLEGRHFIAMHDSPKYKPDCIVCAKKFVGPRRKRSQTRYFCKTCLLPMCLSKCFEDYHTKVKYW